MRKVIKWCSWELKNEFYSSGYFTSMLALYCMLKLFNHYKQVDIIIMLEMFIVNYLISTFYRVILDDSKEYSSKSFLIRGVLLGALSMIVILLVSSMGGWFEGLPSWSGIVTYSLLITAYVTVWIIMRLEKRFDTQKLNEQLAHFKKVRGEDD